MNGDDRSEQLYERAMSLMSQESWGDAIEVLESEPSLVRSDFRFSWNLGWAYLKLEDSERACRWLSQAASLEPENPIGHWALGVALREAHRPDDSERSLMRALELREGILPRLQLALLYLEQGRRDDAERVHREGLEKQPELAERWAAYADFLSDVGRESEAEQATRRSEELATMED